MADSCLVYTSWYKWIGQKVCVRHASHGTLRYFGEIKCSNSIWCGIELDEPLGDNDGVVNNIRYFTCEANHGIFVPVCDTTRLVNAVDETRLPECFTNGLIKEPAINDLRSEKLLNSTFCPTNNSLMDLCETAKQLHTPCDFVSNSNVDLNKTFDINKCGTPKPISETDITNLETLNMNVFNCINQTKENLFQKKCTNIDRLDSEESLGIIPDLLIDDGNGDLWRSSLGLTNQDLIGDKKIQHEIDLDDIAISVFSPPSCKDDQINQFFKNISTPVQSFVNEHRYSSTPKNRVNSQFTTSENNMVEHGPLPQFLQDENKEIEPIIAASNQTKFEFDFNVNEFQHRQPLTSTAKTLPPTHLISPLLLNEEFDANYGALSIKNYEMLERKNNLNETQTFSNNCAGKNELTGNCNIKNTQYCTDLNRTFQIKSPLSLELITSITDDCTLSPTRNVSLTNKNEALNSTFVKSNETMKCNSDTDKTFAKSCSPTKAADVLHVLNSTDVINTSSFEKSDNKNITYENINFPRYIYPIIEDASLDQSKQIMSTTFSENDNKIKVHQEMEIQLDSDSFDVVCAISSQKKIANFTSEDLNTEIKTLNETDLIQPSNSPVDMKESIKSLEQSVHGLFENETNYDGKFINETADSESLKVITDTISCSKANNEIGASNGNLSDVNSLNEIDAQKLRNKITNSLSKMTDNEIKTDFELNFIQHGVDCNVVEALESIELVSNATFTRASSNEVESPTEALTFQYKSDTENKSLTSSETIACPRNAYSLDKVEAPKLPMVTINPSCSKKADSGIKTDNEMNLVQHGADYFNVVDASKSVESIATNTTFSAVSYNKFKPPSQVHSFENKRNIGMKSFTKSEKLACSNKVPKEGIKLPASISVNKSAITKNKAGVTSQHNSTFCISSGKKSGSISDDCNKRYSLSAVSSRNSANVPKQETNFKKPFPVLSKVVANKQVPKPRTSFFVKKLDVENCYQHFSKSFNTSLTDTQNLSNIFSGSVSMNNGNDTKNVQKNNAILVNANKDLASSEQNISKKSCTNSIRPKHFGLKPNATRTADKCSENLNICKSVNTTKRQSILMEATKIKCEKTNTESSIVTNLPTKSITKQITASQKDMLGAKGSAKERIAKPNISKNFMGSNAGNKVPYSENKVDINSKDLPMGSAAPPVKSLQCLKFQMNGHNEKKKENTREGIQTSSELFLPCDQSLKNTNPTIARCKFTGRASFLPVKAKASSSYMNGTNEAHTVQRPDISSIQDCQTVPRKLPQLRRLQSPRSYSKKS